MLEGEPGQMNLKLTLYVYNGTNGVIRDCDLALIDNIHFQVESLGQGLPQQLLPLQQYEYSAKIKVQSIPFDFIIADFQYTYEDFIQRIKFEIPCTINKFVDGAHYFDNSPNLAVEEFRQLYLAAAKEKKLVFQTIKTQLDPDLKQDFIKYLVQYTADLQ